ncbi:flagellar motor switch protein FliG [Ramlibacter sp. AW1]|uniref:Flagellar motor switch protein FliG n=1 Tax=Ramlibacter aurantiacus TaxID=2801330 RepID=A0A936ZRY5_9BURK|nr:flagellar motor switch protein FliG [Ramlibacter aurantiacus]MBL0421451.1 flagellar motor switch protein FliG [Ramlibacter aurantiacus]
MSSTATDDGTQAGAILLLALGEDCAAEVFKHLHPKEVQRLGERMASLTSVSDAQFDEVLARFESSVETQRALVGDTGQYVSKVLRLALGEDRAGPVIDRIVQTRDGGGLEALRWMDATTVANLIRSEHPQIIASILVHLEREQASGVLGALGERLRNDVMLRIATLDGIQPAALEELNEVLSAALASGQHLRRAALGGPKAAAEMLNRLGTPVESAVLGALREQNPELAQRIEDQMFVFGDLMKLDDKAIQVLLRELSTDTLVVALKGAEPALRDRVLGNMSSRAADMLRDDMEAKGPVRVSEVEAQQKEILALVRRLADEGQIVMGGAGGEGFV